MKQQRDHAASPPEWVDITTICDVVYQNPQQVDEIIGDLKSREYREVPLMAEQNLGAKAQITRQALQALFSQGTLTLREYVVTPRGIRSHRAIADFVAQYNLEIPGRAFPKRHHIQRDDAPRAL